MAPLTHHERVGRALELLRAGLEPFVVRELQRFHGDRWIAVLRAEVPESSRAALDAAGDKRLDVTMLLGAMFGQWTAVFASILGRAERNLVHELREVRNKWAHQEPFKLDDVDRVLDSVQRLLSAISAPEGEEAGRQRSEILKLRFEAEQKKERRRANSALIEPVTVSDLSPWRDVVTPHADVASGRYQQAEFAADLWQVHLGKGSDEYREPREFFRRTYLTQSLRKLLVDGIRRLAGNGGAPVVQLQTNFGGGKTHSMLALYHLLGGNIPPDLPGVAELLQEAGVPVLPNARRVVLVGNKISPGNPVTKADGTKVRTLWGELAWQLGHAAGGALAARAAYERIRLDDERATNPGDRLRELFVEYGPALVLLDEWVAYARQLHDQGDLPGGSFETQFSFAQALTEGARDAGTCLLVVSLPASDAASPHAVEDVEVGGVRGRDALARLKNVVGRADEGWRPASAEEGFEIVRRRLFEPLGEEAMRKRDLTARAFAELYRANRKEFPGDCSTAHYEERIKAAYPIHPEVFDQLYGAWATLVSFQRTRGVLRLMATVIHTLWEQGDRAPLIIPATIPLSDVRVQPELTRYLPDHWVPIIEKDVDGGTSLPVRIDGEQPALGRYSAARRVARTVFMASAPEAGLPQRGVEDVRIRLGCALPGDQTAVFSDALRHLATRATYLFHEGTRVWYDTKPTLNKLAAERAEELKRRPDDVLHKVEELVRADAATRGDFAGVHVAPRHPGDVPDEMATRLVILPLDRPHGRGEDSPALTLATELLERRGTMPRTYRNAVLYLAADQPRVPELEEAMRDAMAWESIVVDKVALDLAPRQLQQAQEMCNAARARVAQRIPETYAWLLVPEQDSAQAPLAWRPVRLTGREALAVRASQKAVREEILLKSIGGSVLRERLDRIPLWRRESDAVEVRQLAEDFASFVYLPRLASPAVLARAVEEGVNLMTWRQDTFALADGWDAERGRFTGLKAGQVVSVSADSRALVVRKERAAAQLEQEVPAPEEKASGATPGGNGAASAGMPADARRTPTATVPSRPTRFHGTVALDAVRLGARAGEIATEIVSHLAGIAGSKVRVTLEIEAEVPGGVPEDMERIVMENSRVLQVRGAVFERE